MKKFIAAEHLLTLLLLFFIIPTNAQETSYEDGKTYILGGLDVTGLKSYNEQTVKTYTGLRTGEPITIPGDKISEVI